MMSSLGYFPGCSLETSAREYDKSSRLVCRSLGIELQELPDWSCCGAHAAQHTRRKLSTALGARNLSIAANQGVDNIVTACPACYSHLKAAQTELADNPQFKEELKSDIGLNCDKQLGVYSLLEYLSKVEPEKIKGLVKVNLSGLQVVAYYGCLLVRPPELTGFDDPENPVSMDNLLSLAGVKVLPWDFKVQCCGASLVISDPAIQLNLSGDILEMAHLAGAQAIVVACPLCHINLEVRQGRINKARGSKFNLPVLYFTQLLGLAFGASPQELGIDKHMVDAMPLLTRCFGVSHAETNKGGNS